MNEKLSQYANAVKNAKPPTTKPIQTSKIFNHPTSPQRESSSVLSDSWREMKVIKPKIEVIAQCSNFYETIFICFFFKYHRIFFVTNAFF